MKYIIDFADTVTEEQVNEYFSSNGCVVIKNFNLTEKTYLIESSQEPALTDIVTSLINDSATSVVPLLYTDESSIDLSINDEDQWWKTLVIDNLDMDAGSVTFPRRGKFATVYVMDSGINFEHPEFEDAPALNLYSFNNDFKDYNGHGTAIGGVISGSSCGISSAKLVSVKIFQQGADTYQSHILEALDAIYLDFINNPDQFAIVNISWAVPKNEYIESKLRKLIYQGVYVVCAAGNTGQPIADVTPASMPETWDVGSYNRELEPCNFSATPSAISLTPGLNNFGSRFCWAPGEHIKAPIGDGYGFVAGTSISAAILSACLAYNTWTLLQTDGTVPLEKRRNNSAGFANFAMCRGDFLDLELIQPYDPTPSVACVKVFKLNEISINGSPSSHYRRYIKSGEKFDCQLFYPLWHDSIVSMSELPQGITFDGQFFYGQIFTDSYSGFYIEGQILLLTGKLVNFSFGGYVTAENLTPEDIPEEDRLVQITSFDICCTNSPFLGGGCVTGDQCSNCFDCEGGKGVAPLCVNNCPFGGCGTQACP